MDNEQVTSALRGTTEQLEENVGDAVPSVPSDENAEPKTKKFNSRKLKHGGFSVAVTAMFIAAAVILNIVFGLLNDRLNISFDLTENRIFSIEKSTADYLSSLDDTINFYFCSTEERYTGFEFTFEQAYEIALRFTEANKNFTITFVDRLANPQLLAKFGSELTDTDVIIESEKTGRFRVISYPEYRVLEYSIQGDRISEARAREAYDFNLGYLVDVSISAGAERAFLSAIMNIADTTPIRVAFTTGFGEPSLGREGFEAMANLLRMNGYLVETVDLFTAAEIDPEIDFLVAFAPAYDFSESAVAAVSKWLDNDAQYGKNLLYFAAPELPETKNIGTFLAEEWGMFADYGYIVQHNQYYSFPNDEYGFMQYVDMYGETFADGIASPSLAMTRIRPIWPLFDRAGATSVMPLIITFDGSIFAPFYEIEDLSLSYEILCVAAMATRTRYDNMTLLESNVLVFGSPDIFAGDLLEVHQLSNSRLLLNIFNDLSGRSGISARIMPKSFAPSGFEITARQANAIAIAFVIVIPIVIIATGLFVYFRRRYR